MTGNWCPGRAVAGDDPEAAPDGSFRHDARVAAVAYPPLDRDVARRDPSLIEVRPEQVMPCRRGGAFGEASLRVEHGHADNVCGPLGIGSGAVGLLVVR